MALSDAQIERYSRQIIVPEIGGRGQQRLLGSRLLIAGEISDIEPVLAYMVGAGVGRIFLDAQSDRSRADLNRTIADMRALNPDAKVVPTRDLSQRADLCMLMIGGTAGISAAQTMSRTPRSTPLIVARLDAPGKIAIMPNAPPCPACADAELLASMGIRAETAGFLAMLAAAEAIKVLAGRKPPSPTIIGFDGYQSASRELVVATGTPRCACSGTDPRRRAGRV